MSVDLRKCKVGDKLLSQLGMILTYECPDVTGNYPHIVRYPDGSLGARTDGGFVFFSGHSPKDHDIVEILTSEKKVAKCEIITHNFSFWRCKILNAESICYYSSRKSAIRGARRFCKRIGFECEIARSK